MLAWTHFKWECNMSEIGVLPITTEIKHRGRPRGEWKGPKLRYRPKKWLPEFSQVVFDYIAIPGITQEELGDKYGYTKVHINNILNSPQAAKIREATAKGILNYNEENVTVKLGEISQKAVERMHNFIHNDILYEKSPFAFIEKSIAIRKSIGDEKKDEPKGGDFINNGVIAISGPQAEGLLKSFELALELKHKEIKPAPSIPARVVNG